MSPPTVFVCGATGNQGGALIHNLAPHGIKIHAITRVIDSPAAQRLQSQGILVSKGDFDDQESLKKGMSGCTTLFLNLSPNHTNATAEVEQARQILAIAKEVGVQHVIYTTALGTNNPEALKHWDPNSLVGTALSGKRIIEEEVRHSGFKSWTILRPGNFMTNFLFPLVRMYGGFVETGTFITAYSKDTVLPMVDPNDIGKFAAAAVLDPAKFHRMEIEIASQMMGIEAVLNDISQATGRELQTVYLSDEEIQEQSRQNALIYVQLAMRDLSQFVDMDQLKKWKIELGTFSQFLERERERVEKTYW
ncbi:NmrA-like family domain-containing protein 1 [Penicillium rolfsii]|nr:NmrA-like family domain-containing protein 1 [Penicillium rolfsii]